MFLQVSIINLPYLFYVIYVMLLCVKIYVELTREMHILRLNSSNVWANVGED